MGGINHLFGLLLGYPQHVGTFIAQGHGIGVELAQKSGCNGQSYACDCRKLCQVFKIVSSFQRHAMEDQDDLDKFLTCLLSQKPYSLVRRTC